MTLTTAGSRKVVVAEYFAMDMNGPLGESTPSKKSKRPIFTLDVGVVGITERKTAEAE